MSLNISNERFIKESTPVHINDNWESVDSCIFERCTVFIDGTKSRVIKGSFYKCIIFPSDSETFIDCYFESCFIIGRINADSNILHNCK